MVVLPLLPKLNASKDRQTQLQVFVHFQPESKTKYQTSEKNLSNHTM